MPGNSQRKGAVARKGKGNTAGSGGRVRRGLEGKGPTPKAEDRPYHAAYRAKQAARRGSAGRPRDGRPSGGRDAKPAGTGPEWVTGRNAVLEALTAEVPVKTAYVAEGVERDDRMREILKLAANRRMALLEITRAELDRITSGAVHQGIALQLPAYSYSHPDDLLATALQAEGRALVVALDSITDPRNLGAILRSAAAFGAAGVLIPERRSVQMTAAAWKTSAGAAAKIPVARATNFNRSLRAYADAGFTLIGLDGAAKHPITSTATAPDEPVVLVIGSEGQGLSRLVREACSLVVSIPMAGPIESLNASVAAGIALYELSRSAPSP